MIANIIQLVLQLVVSLLAGSIMLNSSRFWLAWLLVTFGFFLMAMRRLTALILVVQEGEGEFSRLIQVVDQTIIPFVITMLILGGILSLYFNRKLL